MEKLKFEFMVKASLSDIKTNIIAITSIGTENNENFKVPEEFQSISLHAELTSTEVYKKVKKTLTRRGATRRVWISLNEDILRIYKDEDGNIQFKDFLLEQIENIQTESITPPSTSTSAEAQSEFHNMKHISEKFVIEKFNGKNVNVLQWMETFENECTRLNIKKDIYKIELLRLFLQNSCTDWYSSMLIKNTLDSGWENWKKNFCDTYADKGWTPVKHAFEFKYINGYLIDYAIKKERFLLEINRHIDKSSIIDLIALGLPNHVLNRIDRSNLKEVEDLFKEIRGLEHLVKKKFFEKNNQISPSDKMKIGEEKKPCRICENKKKGTRYHPESACWFKDRNYEKQGKEYVRTVNNSELEVELHEEYPKN